MTELETQLMHSLQQLAEQQQTQIQKLSELSEAQSKQLEHISTTHFLQVEELANQIKILGNVQFNQGLQIQQLAECINPLLKRINDLTELLQK